MEKKTYFTAHIKGVEKETGKFSVIASTADIDRDGESIDPKGWDLSHYEKNPVFLWAHNYGELPIGKATKITQDENGLYIDGIFASEEANPKGQQARKLADEGILNAVSVGFIPRERHPDNGAIITKAELLEVSFVPVPANPHALSTAKAKGVSLDLFDIEALDKKEIEQDESKEETKSQEIPEGFIIQSLVFSAENYTDKTATEWAIERGYRADNLEMLSLTLNMVQVDVAKCQENTIQTIALEDDISAYICKPKQEEQPKAIDNTFATFKGGHSDFVEKNANTGSERSGPSEDEFVILPKSVVEELRNRTLKNYKDNEVILTITKSILRKL